MKGVQSLKTKSLIKSLHHIKHLKQLLLFLSENQVAFDIASNDATFWPPILEQCLLEDELKEFMITRGDLETGDDWMVFCQDLVRGNAYEYGLILYENEDEDEDEKEDLVPKFSINDNILAIREYVKFVISGTLPRPGTNVFCVQLVYKNNPHYKQSRIIAHQDPYECLSRSVRWAFMIMKFSNVKYPFIYDQMLGGEEVILSDEKFEDSHVIFMKYLMREYPDNDLRRDVEFEYRGDTPTRFKGITMVIHKIRPFPEY
jgi:hypothetical protein